MVAAPGICMLETKYGQLLRMPQLESQNQSRTRKFWCLLTVALAVCSLTVSVATRYCWSDAASVSIEKSVHKHSSLETSRQRLTKVAASWLRPVIVSALLHGPTSYPRIAPAGPPGPGIFFETSLYNRPPPVHFLA
jgi:hypothetical protein